MKRAGWIAFGIITLAAMSVLSVTQLPVSHPVQAATPLAPVVINFDDLPAGGPGTPAAVTVISQYADKGVTFNGPVALDYSKGLPIPGFAHSGNIAIEQCYSREFCTTPIEMSFTRAQRRVKVWVGYRGPLNEPRTALLRGFDAGGAEVVRATARLPASPSSQPIRTMIEITSASENIVRAAVSFSPTTLLMNGLAVDDVEFDTAGPPPDCATSTLVPTVTLSQPTSGTTVQLNEFILQGTVSTPASAPLEAVTLTVTGSSGSRSLNLLASGLILASGGAFGPVRINELLFPGVNTITVEAQNCRGAGCSSRTITFTPIASDARFVLDGIEVTQVIQDLNNSIPLIAGKRTLARVYLRLTGATSEIRNVSGALTACRPLGDSAICGDFLPNLQALNAITVNSSTDVTAKRRDLNASLNFELPPDWITEGRLHLRISHLETNGIQLSLPCDGCDNPNPNFPIFPRFYGFQNVPPVSFLLYNVSYDANGTTHTADFDHIHHLRSWIQRAYPTSQVIAPNIDFSAGFDSLPSCGSVNTQLFINKVATRIFKAFSSLFGDEVKDSSVYYGIVSDGAGFMRGCSNDFFGVGSGPVGVPRHNMSDPIFDLTNWDNDRSYGDWYGGHEIGHMYGRRHPGFGDCGGMQERDDPNWPNDAAHANGSIGVFGFDFGDSSLGIDPQVYDPAIWADVMTYRCNQWISDYTFNGILERLSSAAATSPFASNLALATANDGLIVSGSINLTNDRVQLEPFLRLSEAELSPRPTTSQFSIDLLDGTGAVLARYPFEPKLNTDIPANVDRLAMIAEVIQYLPATRRVVISKDGRELASRAVSANAPQVRVVSPNGGETLQGRTITLTWTASDPDGDSLAHTLLYSIDAGQTWLPFAIGVKQSSHQVNLESLPGSDRALFRVITTDGVNTSMDDSDAIFRVPSKSPQARIISPGDQSSFLTTQTIVFIGEAFDLEDGRLKGQALHWRSDKQGALGSGRSIAVTGLMPGTHTITFEAKDQSGAAGQVSIQIVITAPAPVADAGTDRSVTIGNTVQLDGRNSRGFGNLTHQWTLLSKPVSSQATLSNANAAQPTFIGDVIGEYIAQLVVKDAAGAQAVDRVKVTVTCCALTMLAQQDTGAALTASLSVMTPPLGARATPFTVSLPIGDRVSVTAPAAIGNLRFLHWRSVTNNRVLTTNTTFSGSVDQNETLAAVYQLPTTVTFSVVSICEGCVTGPAQFSGLTINVITPALGNRATPFNFETILDSRAVLTAPLTTTVNGRAVRFKRWISVTDNRVLTTHRTLSGRVDKMETVAAVYQ
ncbi:MAG: PKD domain-containing protein [Blastocatellia bacterium]